MNTIHKAANMAKRHPGRIVYVIKDNLLKVHVVVNPIPGRWLYLLGTTRDGHLQIERHP